MRSLVHKRLIQNNLSSLHCEAELESSNGGTLGSETEIGDLDAGVWPLDGQVPAYGQTDLWQYEETANAAPVAFASNGNFFAVTHAEPLPVVIQVDAAWHIVSSSEPSVPDSAPPASQVL
jgi:hypothetical protein